MFYCISINGVSPNGLHKQQQLSYTKKLCKNRSQRNSTFSEPDYYKRGRAKWHSKKIINSVKLSVLCEQLTNDPLSKNGFIAHFFDNLLVLFG